MCTIANLVECQTQVRNGGEWKKMLGNHREPQDVKTMAEFERKKNKQTDKLARCQCEC